MLKKILVLVFFLPGFCLLFGQGFGPGTAEQLSEIRAKWESYKPKAVESFYIETPQVEAPYSAGSLNPVFLENGLNTLRFVRYLAGLSENTVTTDELNHLGQHGAVILAKLGGLTHYPERPDDMDEAFYALARRSTSSANISWSSATNTLHNAVHSFCDDSDQGNIDRVGHRRWVLNPKLGKVGFGSAWSKKGVFITLQVFDESNTEKIDMDYVLWPNKGYFPDMFFAPRQAWSISLNPARFDVSKCTPGVKLICLKSGREWVFTANDTNRAGKYFNVEKSNFGMPYCIIFRPDGITSLSENNRYKVIVDGLVDTQGAAQTIEYEVEFFGL